MVVTADPAGAGCLYDCRISRMGTEPYSPMAEAESYLHSGDVVEVVLGDWIIFRPQGENPDTALTLYPGARVDPRS
jgi:hypothetical protein